MASHSFLILHLKVSTDRRSKVVKICCHFNLSHYCLLGLLICVLHNAGTPQSLLQGCVTFGAFSFIIENLNRQQPALAHPSSVPNQRMHMRPALVLPLSLPLPDDLKGAFSSFCSSLVKPKNQRVSSSHQ